MDGGTPVNILIADDDPISRTLLSRMLTADGTHIVTAACDGEEAWQLLRGQSRFDMAMLDVVMPRLDGIDLLHRIRTAPDLCRLPIILCTAANDNPTVRRAIRLSINHYIVKPYTKATVLKKVSLVATKLGRQTRGQDVPAVSERLGVTANELTDLTSTLVREVRGWLALAHNATQPAEFLNLAATANSLKGASLNLGLRQLSHELDAIESAFTHEFTTQHRALFPPSPTEVASAVASVRAEIDQVEQSLSKTLKP